MRGKKFLLLTGLILSLVCISAGAGFADENSCLLKLSSDNYWERAPYRLVHGIVNAGLGWTQLFVEPVKSVRQENQNVVDGIFDGLANTVYYTAIGAWDIVTFWIPGEGGKSLSAKVCVTQTFKS